MIFYNSGEVGEEEVMWEWLPAEEVIANLQDAISLFEPGSARIELEPDLPHPWESMNHKLKVVGRPLKR